MNDAELRSLERLCSKDDLSDDNVASLVCLGLAAATEVRRLRKPNAAAASYACTVCDERIKSWREMEEYQHLDCGGPVELREVTEIRRRLNALRTALVQLREAWNEDQGLRADRRFVDAVCALLDKETADA